MLERNKITKEPVGSKYVLSIDEKSISDINKVSDKNKKGVQEIIAYKKEQIKIPKTFFINGKEIKNTGKKIQGLFNKLVIENPDLAYETRLKLLQLSNVKSFLIISPLIGITYSICLYLIYELFVTAYRLPSIPFIITIIMGAVAGFASYEIIIKKKELDFENIMLKGIVLDYVKEFERQKLDFILELIYFTPVISLLFLIVEYAIILTVF